MDEGFVAIEFDGFRRAWEIVIGEGPHHQGRERQAAGDPEFHGVR